MFHEDLLGSHLMLWSTGGTIVWERCLVISNDLCKEKKDSGNSLWLYFLERDWVASLVLFRLMGFVDFFGLFSLYHRPSRECSVLVPAESKFSGMTGWFIFWCQVLILSALALESDQSAQNELKLGKKTLCIPQGIFVSPCYNPARLWILQLMEAAFWDGTFKACLSVPPVIILFLTLGMSNTEFFNSFC